MTHTKPKFKLTKKEMLKFNDLCDEAACACPQFRGGLIEDRSILLGEITAKQLVKYWLDCDTLFKSGYEECLSEDAVAVFDDYKKYKAKKHLWRKEQECRRVRII